MWKNRLNYTNVDLFRRILFTVEFRIQNVKREIYKIEIKKWNCYTLLAIFIAHQTTITYLRAITTHLSFPVYSYQDFALFSIATGKQHRFDLRYMRFSSVMKNEVSAQTPWFKAMWVLRGGQLTVQLVRSAAPSVVLALDTHDPQAAASSPHGCRAPALSHCPPSRLPLPGSLTVFTGGFAKLLYVGLS